MVNFFGFIIPNTASGFITHSPIYIDGNADFTPANGVKSGSGTQSDPYIIEGWDIKAYYANGIEIRNTDAYFIIRNCYVHSGYYYKHKDGIRLYEVQNGQIENTILSKNYFSLYLSESNYNNICNNSISNNNVGILLTSSSYNNLFNNDVLHNMDGIAIQYSSYNNLYNNSASNGAGGFYLYHSVYNNLFYNNASNNRYVYYGYGIYLLCSSYNNLFNNTANSNSDYGIQLAWSSYNNLFNNTANSNSDYGIYIVTSPSSTLVNNMLEDNGIFVFGGKYFNTHNIDTTNTANGKPIYYYKNQEDINIDGWNVGQIILANCTNFTIRNVDCSRASVGIELLYCNHCSIENSTFNNEREGIYLYRTKHSTISNNKALSNGCGILLKDCSDNIIVYNNISYNRRSGISLEYSDNNIIVNNIASNNRGKYFGSGISLCCSKNNNIYNNDILNDFIGIEVYGFNNNISNNNISNNDYGIHLAFWGHNIISNNNIDLNGHAIFLEYSTYNNISDNNVSKNYIGIRLRHSSCNNVFNNNFLNNHLGLYSYSRYVYENRIYHNNFIDNINQGYDSAVNQWDDGYPSGGNYWSDYSGVDHYNGPNQNISGSDGIGDTPYIIKGNNRDNYPLMHPWGKPRISVEKEFIPSEITTISQGAITTINITNTGDVNITSMTVIDEYVENMRPNDPAELLVTISSDKGEAYAIMPEDLNITSTDNNITISFELPLEVVPIFWENGMLQFGEGTYYLESIQKDWVVGVQYLLHPITEIEIGIYTAAATVTVYSEAGESATEIATGVLIVSEPIELGQTPL